MTISAATICSQRQDLAGKRVAVIGLARSGLACVRFLLRQGAEVVGADAKSADELADGFGQVASLGAEVVPEFQSFSQLGNPDMLVVSPGVPYEHPALYEARAQGAEVIGEIELAYRFCPVPIIAISGTNGKGTTTAMIGLVLEATGIANVVAGNIGLPLISQIDRARQAEVVVAEVNSFQLETIRYFHPWIAVLLNITPDHLDRHADLQQYAAAKMRLFENQTADDYAVLCVADPTVAAIEGRIAASVLTASTDSASACGRVEDGWLVVEADSDVQRILPVDEMPVPGWHNLTNALAASLVARVCGATGEQITRGLTQFSPADHLLAEVMELGGVRFIDDSKATNTAAAIADIETLDGPLLIIVGGQGKEVNFARFGRELTRRCRFVCLIGESGPAIEAAIGRSTEITQASSMQQAVEECYRRAQPGETVALVPGCASFDMFEDQTDRGEQFVQAVRQIARRAPQGGV